MSKAEWKMRWFKVHHNFDDPKKWTSKIDNDELGAWIRLCKCASKCHIRGTVQIDGGLPYTVEQLNLMIKTDKNYLKKWEKQGAIKVEKGIIFIVKWEDWQNEQDRKNECKKDINGLLNRQLNSTLNGKTDLDLDLDIKKKELKSYNKPPFNNGVEQRTSKHISELLKGEVGK